MNKNFKCRIATKTDIGCERSGNEDNFLTSSDLSSGKWLWVNNETFSLSDKGAMLVVADGMGGMSAGEVASEIAVETVKELFSADKPEALPLEDETAIRDCMCQVVIEADKRIKKRGKNDPETSGMGTTIVMAWIVGNKVYITWCGDSRAYVCDKDTGLRQLSKDHSTVQELVDKGILTEDEAFDYPQRNYITRSLGDHYGQADPDFNIYSLCDNDILLLCSDGLCGMIRDRDIRQILDANSEDMGACADALIEAAKQAGGHDNITVSLCQVVSGAGKRRADSEIYEMSSTDAKQCSCKTKIRWVFPIAILFVLFAFFAGWFCGRCSMKHSLPENDIQNVIDTTKNGRTIESQIIIPDRMPEQYEDSIYHDISKQDTIYQTIQ